MSSATSSLTIWYLHLVTGSSALDSKSLLTRSGTRARAEKRLILNWLRFNKSRIPTKCPGRRPRSRNNGKRIKDSSWPLSNKKPMKNISTGLSIGIILPTTKILARWYWVSSRKHWIAEINSEFSSEPSVTLYTG